MPQNAQEITILPVINQNCFANTALAQSMPESQALAKRQELQMAAVERLLGQTPEETDKKLKASLQQRYGLSVRRKSVVLAGEYEFEFVFTPQSDPQGALQAIELSFLTGTPGTILEDVTRLDSECVRAKASHDENTLFLETWAKNLYNFPADVARACCREWAWHKYPDPTKNNPFKFFPVWNEFLHGVYHGRTLVFRGLAERMARRAMLRRVLLVSMKKYRVE